MKIVLLVTGLACVAMGTLWALQGLGIVMWPQESFMLAQPQWAGYGAATAITGAALIWFSQRRR